MFPPRPLFLEFDSHPVVVLLSHLGAGVPVAVMASYPLEVAPPLLRNIDGGLVTEDALRENPQEFFQVGIPCNVSNTRPLTNQTYS